MIEYSETCFSDLAGSQSCPAKRASSQNRASGGMPVKLDLIKLQKTVPLYSKLVKALSGNTVPRSKYRLDILDQLFP